MKKKRNSSHGAISVFLALVLVPCIVVTSVFVDVGRVKLGQNLVEASGDLALNSLLTHYDYDLNDYYGMVASCQNINDFYSTSADYFLRLLSSKGLSAEETKTLWTQIEGMVKSEDISNLLQMELLSDQSSMIAPVEGANMENAAIIKEQIVEFMKYRAPINIVAGFVSSLTGAGKEVEDQQKDKELSDTKRKSYEAENELMEEAFSVYEKLYKYQKIDPQEAGKVDRINQIVARLNGYRGIYREIHEALVYDLYNTENLKEVRKTVYKKSNHDPSSPYSDEKNAKLSNVRSIMQSLAKAITAYKKAKTALEDVFPTYDRNTVYDIQYWAQHAATITNKITTMDNESKNIMDNWCKLENAYAYLDPEEDTGRMLLFSGTQYNGYDGCTYEDTYSWHYDKLCSQAQGIFNRVLSVEANNESSGDKYIKYMSIFQRISTLPANKDKIKPDKRIVPSVNKSVEATISDIYTQITADKAKMKECSDALKDVPGKLNKLKTLVKKYKEAFNKWDDKAKGTDTDMGKTDRDEVANEKLMKDLANLTDESIDALKGRVEQMKELYDSMIKSIDAVKYGNKKLLDIKTFKNAKDASGIASNKIKTTKSELKDYFETSFSFTPAEGNAADANISQSNHPNLKNPPAPALWVWMNDNFESVMEGEEADKKNDMNDKFKKLQEESGTKGGGDGKDKESQEAESDSVTENSIKGHGDAFGVLDAFSSVAKLFTDLASGIGEGDLSGALSQRMETLYATEYVAGMFSSYTSEKEALYKLADEKGDGKYKGSLITIDTMKEIGKNSDFTKLFEKDNKDWTSVKPKDAKNRSLTTKPINKHNNWAHGAEWEYILFGKDTSQDNVNTALTGMYAIRFILNVPSAFMFYWSGDNLTATVIAAVANAIQSATCGIVPAPLIKAILILILAAVETVNDVSMLKAGIPVKFIKTKKDGKPDPEWVTDIEAIGDDLVKKLASEASDSSGTQRNERSGLHLSYNNYMYIFLLLGFDSTDRGPQMYERTARVMQANLNYLIDGNGKGDSFQLTKAFVHFNINAKVRIKPLMLALPYYTIDVEGNPYEETDWCTFSYKATRGYS
ncbi:MAG: DUF5702 domain-containing protein [Oscillospiraceae bacterium]|nr:DUF5702 domain-containing protein [Oscillospiraceae bacterium]